MTKKEIALLAEFEDPNSWEDVGEASPFGWKIQKLKGSKVHRLYSPKRLFWRGISGIAEATEASKAMLVFTVDEGEDGYQQIHTYGESKGEILSIMREREILSHLKESKLK